MTTRPSEKTDEEVEFVSTVKTDEKNVLVSISSFGVQVYGYTDRPGCSSSVITIPYQEIDEVRVTQETRLRRVLTATGIMVGGLAVGCFGCLVGYNLLQGKPVGMGPITSIFFSVMGPLCLLVALVAPITYFTRLGHLLHVRVGKRWMRRTFEPKFWDEHGRRICDLISQYGKTSSLPPTYARFERTVPPG